MHLGAILPNYGAGSSPSGIRRLAELAEERGLDSVWTTEHVVVGPDAVDPYGRVYDPLVTLGWIAGWTERIGLGTSIAIVPLHNPYHLAKQAATVQELSGGRLALGVGMGWYRPEFDFMGVEFEGRGRRADEGRTWSYRDATAEPRPSPPPELWIGGSSARAVRRARELGDVWHPSRGSDPAHVRLVRERHPGLRTIPRTSPEQVEAMLEAGADGVVVSFPDEDSLRALARRYR
jgi:alkanesulfonate monooxygenase SsuD/methylene tetrahydromethanopterin reductase-like flavin-dependent oxidoreductase (luciferase family)